MPTPPNIASIFLSHQWKDKDLVIAVQRQLGRFGVIAWRDETELSAGADLRDSLTTAVGQCRLTAAFLSPGHQEREWLRLELKSAIEFEKEGLHNVVPIFLGDPKTLVTDSELLRDHWLDTESHNVNRLGVVATDRDPRRIAEALTRAVLRRLDWKGGSPGVFVDQRGLSGERVGDIPTDTVPELFLRGKGPVVVLRPDDGRRSLGETLVGEALGSWWADVRWALGELRRVAPGGIRKLRIAGAGQLGVAWALGRAFDRSSRVELWCFPRPASGDRLTNEGQDFLFPLKGGNPDCATLAPERGIPELPTTDCPVIDLLLLPDSAVYLSAIQEFRRHDRERGSAVWVRTGAIDSSEQAMSLVKDVVALLTRLRHQRGTTQVRVFTALPFHFLPLLSANLTHVVPRVTFMEYHRAAADAGSPTSGLYLPIEL